MACVQGQEKIPTWVKESYQTAKEGTGRSRPAIRRTVENMRLIVERTRHHDRDYCGRARSRGSEGGPRVCKCPVSDRCPKSPR